jgi:histidinol-phosphate aminotransferase
MSRYWSALVRELKPYVPGEQPRIPELVKLNTNENPYGPSPRALAAIVAEASDDLRLYPDPEATGLREALARHHGVRPEQIFVGNGSDEVLAHAFAALLKHERPLLFPDITYSFYPVYCRLFGRRDHPAQSERPDRGGAVAERDRDAAPCPTGHTGGDR